MKAALREILAKERAEKRAASFPELAPVLGEAVPDELRQATAAFEAKPLVQQAHITALTAYHNERQLRAQLNAMLDRWSTFWGRLRWLLTGN